MKRSHVLTVGCLLIILSCAMPATAKPPRPGTDDYYEKNIKGRFELNDQGEMVPMKPRTEKRFAVEGTIARIHDGNKLLIQGFWAEHPFGLRKFGFGIVEVSPMHKYAVKKSVSFDPLLLVDSARYLLTVRPPSDTAEDVGYYVPAPKGITEAQYQALYRKAEYRSALEQRRFGSRVVTAVEEIPERPARELYSMGVQHTESKQFDKAIECFRKAADRGHSGAQLSLAKIYASGNGTERSYIEAFKWYRAAAIQGEPEAQVGLGSLYANGLGTEEDAGKAIEWFGRAAAQGNAIAQANLGIIYHYGKGVAVDYGKAGDYYTKAAAQNNPTAQLNLGVMFENGLGVRRDHAKAVEWFKKAALQGNETAKRNLQLAGERVPAAPDSE